MPVRYLGIDEMSQCARYPKQGPLISSDVQSNRHRHPCCSPDDTRAPSNQNSALPTPLVPIPTLLQLLPRVCLLHQADTPSSRASQECATHCPKNVRAFPVAVGLMLHSPRYVGHTEQLATVVLGKLEALLLPVMTRRGEGSGKE